MTEPSVVLQYGEPAIDAVSIRFHDFCKRFDLSEIANAAEKHGSLVWECGKTIDALDRYMTFSLTPDELNDEASAFWVEMSGRRVQLLETLLRSGSTGGGGEVQIIDILALGDSKEPLLDIEHGLHMLRIPLRASVTILVQSDSARTSQVHESWIYDQEGLVFQDINDGHLDRAWESAWQWAQQLSVRNLTERFTSQMPRG